MADILTRIEAYKREEIAAAKRARSPAAVEAAAMAAAPPRGFLRAIERRLAQRRLCPDRRDQEGEPVQGPDPRRLRPPCPCPRLRSRRRGVPLGADRCAVVSRQPGPPGRGACGDRIAGAAQGFHLRALPGRGSARVRGRLHPHHHGGARRRRCGGNRGGRVRPRHGRAARSPRRRRTGRVRCG